MRYIKSAITSISCFYFTYDSVISNMFSFVFILPRCLPHLNCLGLSMFTYILYRRLEKRCLQPLLYSYKIYSGGDYWYFVTSYWSSRKELYLAFCCTHISNWSKRTFYLKKTTSGITFSVNTVWIVYKYKAA